MAIVKEALRSKTASATLGKSINFWVERRVQSARRPGRKPGAPTGRQNRIQELQRDLFDRWHDLTQAQRDAWTSYAARSWRGMGAFRNEHSGIFCFSARNLYLVDYGLALRVDPPPDDHVPVPLRVSAVSSVPAGYVVVGYDLGSLHQPGDFADMWISQPMISSHGGVRYPRFTHAAYVPWVTGPGTLIPVQAGYTYAVRVRGVSVYGVASRLWVGAVAQV